MALIYLTTKDSDGNTVISANEKGLPIVIDDEKEQDDPDYSTPVDAIHLLSKIPDLQKESKTHRLKKNELSDELEKLKKSYDGVDPEKAKEALKTFDALSVGDLTKKEEVEKIKTEAEQAWKSKFDDVQKNHASELEEKNKVIKGIEDSLRKSIVSTAFSSSGHFSGQNPTTKLPPDVAEAYFGKHFRVEKDEKDNMIIVGSLKGKDIFSKSRPGSLADLDEAMEKILEAYPNKDAILFKSVGSGAPGGGGFVQHKTINSGDIEAFGNNLEDIAKGKVRVKRGG